MSYINGCYITGDLKVYGENNFMADNIIGHGGVSVSTNGDIYVNGEEMSVKQMMQLVKILVELHQDEIDIYKIANALCMNKEK